MGDLRDNHPELFDKVDEAIKQKRAIDHRLMDACKTIESANHYGTVEELAKMILGQIDLKDTLIDALNLKIAHLEKEATALQIKSVRLECLEEMLQEECEMILNNSEHFYFLKKNEREFIVEHFKTRFNLKDEQ